MKTKLDACTTICSIFLLINFIIASSWTMQISAKSPQRKKTINKKVVKKCPDKPFTAGCVLPFKNEVIHEIDQRCPLQGLCSSGAGTKLQNEVKNNFCAVGSPISVGITTFDLLQKAVDRMVVKHQITYGTNHTPPKPKDRAKLKSLATVDVNHNAIMLGEGALVTFEGFVLDAKHDDSFPLGFTGESVNCNNPALNWNDIHIALGETAMTPECSSVTVEISPHFRPALWDRFDSNPITSPFVTNPLPVKELRVRITGQLFFDGSHIPKPCQAPMRRTSWEIHPVYAIKVFDSSKEQFVTFEEWAKDK
jgi:hypothetical protein